MKHRRVQHKKIIRNKNLLISILSFILILGLSFLISSKLALIIYKDSTYKIESSSSEKVELPGETHEMKSNKTNDESLKQSEKKQDDKGYVESLNENSLVVFQGGVFNSLDNAEDFKKKIGDEILVSIVNDGKYERVILGVATKENFQDVLSQFKDKNIQFIKQVYKIPNDVKYNSEIIDIINVFVDFILHSKQEFKDDEIDVCDLKQKVNDIEASYGKEGSYKIFDGLKDMILELDDKCNKKDLESVFDFIYTSFKEYKD